MDKPSKNQEAALEKPKSRSVGRPTKYKEEYCEKLIEHMSQGLSFESFAGTVGVSKETIYTWTEKYQHFLDAKKEGSEKCRVWWETQGMRGLWLEKDGLVFNTTLWIFNMKNRFGWTDRRDVEVKGEMQVKLPSADKKDAVLLTKQDPFIEVESEVIEDDDDSRDGQGKG